MTSTIAYYTPAAMSDEVILARAAHANRMHLEEFPEDPPLIVEDALKRLRNLPSTSRVHLWLLHHGGAVVAEAYLGWAELPTNRQVADIGVSVELAFRGRGLGAHLLSLALAGARDAGRTLILSSSTDRVPGGARFLTHYGFEKGLEAHINQLVVAHLDRSLMTDWRTAGRSRASDYAIEVWDGPVPEERLAAFAELANVMNSEPRGTLEIEDTLVTPEMIRDGERFLFSNASRRLIACARHVPTGCLAGFTELAWNPRRAAIVWQAGTGVVDAHRNKGLGRWLKATNIEAMLAANSEARFVRTGNADSNAPMLAINRKMGFAPFMSESEWQGRADEIARRLGAARRGPAAAETLPARDAA